MKGTLSISHNGGILQQKAFDSEFNKNRIIEQWKRQYGKGFKNAEISEVLKEEVKRVKSRYEK